VTQINQNIVNCHKLYDPSNLKCAAQNCSKKKFLITAFANKINFRTRRFDKVT